MFIPSSYGKLQLVYADNYWQPAPAVRQIHNPRTNCFQGTGNATGVRKCAILQNTRLPTRSGVLLSTTAGFCSQSATAVRKSIIPKKTVQTQLEPLQPSEYVLDRGTCEC